MADVFTLKVSATQSTLKGGNVLKSAAAVPILASSAPTMLIGDRVTLEVGDRLP